MVAAVSSAQRSSTAVESTLRALRDALNGGVFARGDRLPGERELAQRFGVSRATLRHALLQLADEGRLVPHPQRGWFVAPGNVLSEPPTVLQTFTEMARSRGLRATSRILLQDVRPARIEEAERLGIAPAAAIVDLKRLRGLDDVPVCIDRNVLPLSRVPRLAELDLTDRSLFETLETVAGIRLARSSYSVQATGAEPEDAALLDILPGTPVLVGDETAYDQRDVPTMLARVVYRGDAYRFETTLFRSRG